MFVSLPRFDSEGKKFFMQRIMVYEVSLVYWECYWHKNQSCQALPIVEPPPGTQLLATCHVAVASLYHKFWAKY